MTIVHTVYTFSFVSENFLSYSSLFSSSDCSYITSESCITYLLQESCVSYLS